VGAWVGGAIKTRVFSIGLPKRTYRERAVKDVNRTFNTAWKFRYLKYNENWENCENLI